jgi:GNAT superfamily N-acetyltransferase
MELWGDITPVTLEQFAIRVLELVESRLNMRPTDDIRAIVADRTGFMREWALTA